MSTIRDILVTVKRRSDKSRPDEVRLLGESLDLALNSLSRNFNYSDPFNPAGKEMADYHKMFESVAENFAQLGKELLKMRSSYLPFTMLENALKDIESADGSSKKISEIIDADTTLESYENTFFRLLGMPSTADIRDKNLVTVTQNGKYVPFDEDKGFYLTYNVLQKRAQDISDRLGWPTKSAYDFLSGSAKSLDRLSELGFTKDSMAAIIKILSLIKDLNKEVKYDENTARIASEIYSVMDSNRKARLEDVKTQAEEAQDLPRLFGPEIAGQETYRPFDRGEYLARILEISLVWLEPTIGYKITLDLKKHLWNEHVEVGMKDMTLAKIHDPSTFWQYSYLLFPPVQDERIATCIHEPSKMVAEPFLPESMRVVNGHRLKSTLLEAILRIRLDAISGFPQNAAQVSASGMSVVTEGDSRPMSPEEMGLLEALLIVRLFSALHGFALDVKQKVKAAHKAQNNAKMSPSGEPPPGNDHTPGPNSKKVKSPKQLELESIRLVEESLLLLFGDGSTPEALAFQEGVARNSGVKTAHLMGAALSILDVPKRWANKKLGEIEEVEAKTVDKKSEPNTSSLRAHLGSAKGVGAVDMLCFLIALFTAKENTLIALLNDRQFQYMKDEYPDGFFDAFSRGTMDTGRAVCEVADLAFDTYTLFRYMVSDNKPGFKWPPLDNYDG